MRHSLHHFLLQDFDVVDIRQLVVVAFGLERIVLLLVFLATAPFSPMFRGCPLLNSDEFHRGLEGCFDWDR